MSHTYTHLGKSFTLYHKRPGDVHFYFSPRWGNRGQHKHHSLKDPATGRALTLPEAEREARNLIEAHFRGPTEYEKLREATKLRDRATVGAILEAWELAGCPGPDRRPLTPDQAARHIDMLSRLKPWWTAKLVNHIEGPTLGDYAEWRRAHCRKGFSGDRVIDRELATLSCCFTWAQATGRTKTNPFANRPRFQAPADVTHCPAYMPAGAEELHTICGRLMSETDPHSQVAGAQLMFCALTGLRPGETEHLQWNAPFRGQHPDPGCRYPVTIEGQSAELLAVHRNKGGINPAIRIRPALAQFLEAWARYSRPKWDSPYYFPDPDQPKTHAIKPSPIAKRLRRVVAQLGLPERHPHSMRAYYVRVRRSQGTDDGAIAVELGQGSGAKLIVTVYGDPRGIIGDGRYDWLPAESSPVKPAWERLIPEPTTATNIVQL